MGTGGYYIIFSYLYFILYYSILLKKERRPKDFIVMARNVMKYNEDKGRGERGTR